MDYAVPHYAVSTVVNISIDSKRWLGARPFFKAMMTQTYVAWRPQSWDSVEKWIGGRFLIRHSHWPKLIFLWSGKAILCSKIITMVIIVTLEF